MGHARAQLQAGWFPACGPSWEAQEGVLVVTSWAPGPPPHDNTHPSTAVTSPLGSRRQWVQRWPISHHSFIPVGIIQSFNKHASSRYCGPGIGSVWRTGGDQQMQPLPARRWEAAGQTDRKGRAGPRRVRKGPGVARGPRPHLAHTLGGPWGFALRPDGDVSSCAGSIWPVDTRPEMSFSSEQGTRGPRPPQAGFGKRL